MTAFVDWVPKRLKHVARVNGSSLSDSTDPARTFTYIDISAVSQGKMLLEAEPIAFEDAPSRARRLARPGDIAISTVRTYLRAVAPIPITDRELVFSTGFAILHPNRGVEARWLAYALQSDSFVDQVIANSEGISYPAISVPKLMALRLLLPKAATQRAIADFLDRETAQIDRLVAYQGQLIDLLRERRAAALEREFQDLDDKRATSAGRVLAKLSRPTKPGGEVITAYRDGVVTLRSNRRAEGYTFSDTEAGYQGIEPGDLVFHALDAFAGAVGVSDSAGNATPVYHVCRPTQGDDAEYLALLLRYLGHSGFLAVQAPNVRQRSVDFRNWSTFARVPLNLPEVGRQREFVAATRVYTAKIDALIATARKHVELAKERRAALITEAVTGQISIKEAG